MSQSCRQCYGLKHSICQDYKEFRNQVRTWRITRGVISLPDDALQRSSARARTAYLIAEKRTLPRTAYVRGRGLNAVESPLQNEGEHMTEDEKKKARNAWVSVLRPWFDQISARGTDQGLRRRQTVIAIVKNNSDVFVSRYDASLPESFEDMISGTLSEPIRPPILVFLFDDSRRAPLRGIISGSAEHWNLWNLVWLE